MTRIRIVKSESNVFLGVKINLKERAIAVGTFTSEESAIREVLAISDQIRTEAKLMLAQLHKEQLTAKLKNNKWQPRTWEDKPDDI